MNPSGDLKPYFDKLAGEGYFATFDPEEGRVARSLISRMAIRPGMRLIEPGCGSGRFSRMLAEAVGPEGEVLAVDVSPRFIEKARSITCPEWLRFECMDFLVASTLKNGWDGVVFFNVFPHLAHGKSLELARGLLQPEGKIWILHSCSRNKVNDIHRGASCPGLHHHLLPENDTLFRLLEEAGFSVKTLLDEETFFYCEAVPAS